MNAAIPFLKKSEPIKNRGFTLMEVMAAIAILAITLGVMVQTQSNAARSIIQTDHQTHAMLLASQKMEEFLLEHKQKEIAATPESTGGFEAPFEQYKWSVKIEDFQYDISFIKALAKGAGKSEQQNPLMDTLLPRVSELIARTVKELTVSVKWQEGETERQYILTTHLVNFKGAGTI